MVLRPVVIEQPFSKLSFFVGNTAETKNKNPKFEDLTEGKVLGRLRIPIFGNKIWKLLEYNVCAKTLLNVFLISGSVKIDPFIHD